jgi:hypothetical protein
MASNKKKDNAEEFISFFKERVYFYQKELGLLSYWVDILPQMKEGTQASTYDGDTDMQRSNRRVTIAYSLDFMHAKDTTLVEVDKSAFHEVCEVMMLDIRRYAEKSCSEVIIDKEIHKVIRTLENVLWEKLRGKNA